MPIGPRSIADELAPLATQLRSSYSVVRPVSQSSIEFRNISGSDHFRTIRGIVLKWVNSRAGRPLPAHAWQGENFELEDIGSQRTAAVQIESPRFWAAKLDDSDRNVAQRNWVTEIAIADRSDNSVILGSRLLCVTRGQYQPFQPSIQRFLRTVVEQLPGAFVEGRRIETTPWIVKTEADVDNLVALITSKNRRLDVILSSLPEGIEDPSYSAIDALDVHRRTYGAAHVAIITGPASFFLSDRLGNEFSTFRGAVRTYKPGFDIKLDEPFSHPLALPARIQQWPDGGIGGYQDFIVGQTLTRAAAGRDTEQHLPSFTNVRRIAAQLKLDVARNAGSTSDELLVLAEAEIAEFRDTQEKDKETYQGLVDQYECERDEAIARADQINAANSNLRQRLQLLEGRVRNRVVESPETVIPQSLDEFDVWCRDNMSGAVEVHNRALQGVKKSRYDDYRLIYQAMLTLRDFYVPMKRKGGRELQIAFESACNSIGIFEEPTFSGERHGEQGDEYIVKYAGKNRLLDRHLKKGNSKEQRYCFRLYFFWDEDTEQVVVGWLPSHLDTRVT